MRDENLNKHTSAISFFDRKVIVLCQKTVIFVNLKTLKDRTQPLILLYSLFNLIDKVVIHCRKKHHFDEFPKHEAVLHYINFMKLIHEKRYQNTLQNI